MEFQRQAIREKVAENGWQITELEKGELDWWAQEMWRLESIWSPAGKTAFITLLLEPEYAEEVWAVMVSKEKPARRGGNPDSFSLPIKKWDKELPAFLKFLSALRNQPD